jgi:DNA-binding CsgD family transcriptional regulator
MAGLAAEGPDHAAAGPVIRTSAWAALAVAAFAALLGLEAATEENGLSATELVLEVTELLLTIGAAVGVALVVVRMNVQHEERITLMRDLATARAEGESWRKRVQAHLDGVGLAIERQLEEWDLTPAEREVALFMLKGFSHKEIATLRKTSEATVRQQARSVYDKSGMNGRAAFCAFFLEDLLPGRPGEASPPAYHN